MKKLLPIGSVVLLQNGVKKVMVTGYMAMDQNNSGKIYDYSGCIYPEGLLSSDQTLLFYHDQIEQVCFEGYQGEEYALFQKQLEEVQKRFHTEETTVDTLE